MQPRRTLRRIECQQRLLRIESLPEPMQCAVQQRAAGARIKPRLRALQRACMQAMHGKAAERTGRLIIEQPRAPRLRTRRRQQRRACLIDKCRQRQVANERARDGCGRDREGVGLPLRERGNQRAGTEFLVTVVHRMRKHHFAGADPPAVTLALRQRQRMLGRRCRLAPGALHRDRKQRVGLRRRRPAIIGEVRDPQVIESQVGRLDHAQHLNSSIAAFGLEQRLGEMTPHAR